MSYDIISHMTPPSIFNLSSPERPDPSYIKDMFDKLAWRYDLFTLLMGFGRAHAMRRATLRPLQPHFKVLDLGCGTGDLVLAAARHLGPQGHAVGFDFSSQMLTVAQNRYERLRPKCVCHFRLIEKAAEQLPLPGETFDLIVSGFVLRNLYQNIRPILSGVYQSLVTGGQISFLDLTEPEGWIKKKLFRFYMNTFVAFYGTILFGKNYPIPYLPDSAARFLKPVEFTQLLKETGFCDIKTRSFFLGSVTLYQATR